MENVEKLLKTTVEELDKLLNAGKVLGEPIDRGTTTIIPMVSYGFGFGAGSGAESGKGGGGGTGAGGGIKPLGAIIIDDAGARVEGIQTAASSLASVIGRTAERVLDRATAARKDRGAAPEPDAGTEPPAAG